MPDETPAPGPDPATIAFHYIKSNQFRVIHVDGVHGGVTPRLQVQMGLFSERVPIPQKAVHRLSDEGRPIEPPIDVLTRDGIVREVEVEAIVDVATAKALVEWLNHKIAFIEDRSRG